MRDLFVEINICILMIIHFSADFSLVKLLLIKINKQNYKLDQFLSFYYYK